MRFLLLSLLLALTLAGCKPKPKDGGPNETNYLFEGGNR